MLARRLITTSNNAWMEMPITIAVRITPWGIGSAIAAKETAVSLVERMGLRRPVRAATSTNSATTALPITSMDSTLSSRFLRSSMPRNPLRIASRISSSSSRIAAIEA